MKQYSFLLEKLDTRILSKKIGQHYNNMRKFTTISPQMMNQLEQQERNKAAREIRSFHKSHLRRREWARQISRIEKNIKEWDKRHP